MHLGSSGDRTRRTLLTRITPFCTGIALATLTACGGGGDGNGTETSSGTSATEASDGLERNSVVNTSSQPPQFEAWEADMTEYGHKWGRALQKETNYLSRFKLRYYDAQRVHEQIANYLGENQPWRSYGQVAEATYKKYLENADFRAAGWERFPHGLFIDAIRNGDDESQEYLAKLRDAPPFSYPSQSGGEWSKQKYSREVAYSLETQILADRVGHERKSGRIQGLADLALGHIYIWVEREYIHTDRNWQFFQAFMGGLTGSALIAHYERAVEVGNPDARVPPALKRLGNFLWDTMWVSDVNGSGFGAFKYVEPTTTGVGSNAPAPDLNMLIAPMFGWLFYHTGDDRWLKRGDAIFAGGVALADLGSGKRFNQNYRSSFQYVDWRTRGVERHGG
ncbi:hypothetical protein [Halofilum ochraceum]|uniref:hypothetical protein n=1 Tax=Halofilum ochraceum TaxID=1611323 RepID=UPI00111306AB|nr:hypothetical protein [Halofilum ochraceum]